MIDFDKLIEADIKMIICHDMTEAEKLSEEMDLAGFRQYNGQKWVEFPVWLNFTGGMAYNFSKGLCSSSDSVDFILNEKRVCYSEIIKNAKVIIT